MRAGARQLGALVCAAVMITGFGGAARAQAPTITDVSPATGPTTGGTAVRITGSGFACTVNVTFGGAAATDVVVDSLTQLHCRAPGAGATGPVTVTVWSSAKGTGARADGFTYRPPDGTKKWEFVTGARVSTAPAIGGDGTLYVCSWDGKVYALDPAAGTKKWEFLADAYVNMRSSPAIGDDGTIYVGSDNGKVYALKPADGTKLWEFDTGAAVQSSPAIGADGTIYVGSDKVYALDPAAGTQKWAFESGSVNSSPAIGSDGTIYVGSWDGRVHALNPVDGTQKWAFALAAGYHVESSPAIGSDGTIYVGGSDSKVHALNAADGTQKWAFAASWYIDSSPAIGSDGTIYVGSWNGRVYALNPADGTKKWEFVTGSFVTSSPAIGSDGRIYVGGQDRKVYALDPADGTKVWEFVTGSGVVSSPAIGSDGTIYVGSWDSKVYALYSSSGGLATSPWPKFHRNNRNTGRNVVTIGSVTLSNGPLVGGTNVLITGSGFGGEVHVTFGQVAATGVVADTEGSIRCQTPASGASGPVTVTVSSSTNGLARKANGFTYRPADGTFKWGFNALAAVNWTPAIGADGTIYAGNSDGDFYACNPADGARKWELHLGPGEFFSPAIGSDGTIYVGGYHGDIYALNPSDGTLKWDFTTDSRVECSPAIGSDGTIYVGDTGGKVYALDPAGGTRKWEFLTNSPVSALTIGVDGTIYAIGGYKLHALNAADGTQKWEFFTGYDDKSSPAIGADGTIYVGSSDGNVYALDPGDGTKKWEFFTNGGLSYPAIGADGTIYAGSGNGLGKLYAINPSDGTKRWESATVTMRGEFTPSIGADGTIYVVSRGNPVHAFSPVDGTTKWLFGWPRAHSAPAISSDGTIYVGGIQALFALYGSSAGLAVSPWPKYGQNDRNTGAAPRIPTVTVGSVSPTGGPLEGGTNVTVDGSGFCCTMNVTFGQVAATAVVVENEYRLRCVAPAGSSAGPVDVTVSSSANGQGTKPDGFAYLVPPAVAAVSPAAGLNTGVTDVTLSGTDFVAGATARLSDGANTALTDVTVVSSTQSTGRVPAGVAAGTYDILVTTVGGTSVPGAGSRFTANRAPVANAQTVDTYTGVETAITLTGSDPDVGAGDTIAFSIQSGPSNGALSGTAPNVKYSGNGGFAGTDSFVFKVTDARGAAAAATVTLHVVGPPVANAGADFTAGGSSLATLAGSGTDPAGSPLTYRWTQVSGPTVALVNAGSATATFTVPNQSSGSMRFQLEVSNGRLASTDTVDVTINGLAQMITPLPGSTLTGSSVRFDWTAGGAAEGYRIIAGSTAGATNWGSSGALSLARAYTFTALPAGGETVFVRLFTKLAGVEQYKDYTYTAATVVRPALTFPAPNGSTLAGATVNFQWTAGSGAVYSGYAISVGTAAGGSATYGSYSGTNRSWTNSIAMPRNGSTVYVFLRGKIGTTWQPGMQYSFKAGP